MSSYHCYDQQGEYRVGGFPEDAVGLDEWRRLLEQLDRLEEPVTDQSDQDPLAALRALHQRRNQLLRPRCPRVFVSHRQCDRGQLTDDRWRQMCFSSYYPRVSAPAPPVRSPFSPLGNGFWASYASSISRLCEFAAATASSSQRLFSGVRLCPFTHR
jgi:hypothetical protein